jgi:two-component system, NarL family, response regulator LiaR
MNDSRNLSSPIRVLVVDDHGMVRFGLRGYLESVPNLQVVGEASSGEQALELMESVDVDIVLMDLVLPGMSGADATREIAKRYQSVRVIILTSFLDDAHILPAIRAGAAGYLLKDITPDDLSKAVIATFNGQSVLHPKVMAQLASNLTPESQMAVGLLSTLSERELEVLRLLTHGLQNNEVAEQLSVSENTVRTHISNILTKLDLRDRTQAALFGVRFFEQNKP